MANNVSPSTVRMPCRLSSILAGAAMALLIMASADAAQQPAPVRSSEATGRYEAGLKAAHKLLEFYGKQATEKRTPVEALYGAYKAENEFFESLRGNGKEGVEAAEKVALGELSRFKSAYVQRFWIPLTNYLAGPALSWGRSHLNSLLRSEKVPLLTRTRILVQAATVGTELANWLDDEAALPIILSFLTNTDYYATREVSLDGITTKNFSFRMRFCDLGVELVCDIYKPAEVKWIDAETSLSQAEADRQRNENVEAAKRWIDTRLARLAARKDLLKIASSYWRLKLTPGQTATVLDLWTAIESRNASGNIRDLKALADMLLADLKRTGDKPREGIEKDFHRAIHERLAAILAKAGFKPEGAENNLPANVNEERGWLRNATSKLARGAAPDQWMRYEWEKYHEELGEAVLADIKAAESSPPPPDGTKGEKLPAKPSKVAPKDNLWSP